MHAFVSFPYIFRGLHRVRAHRMCVGAWYGWTSPLQVMSAQVEAAEKAAKAAAVDKATAGAELHARISALQDRLVDSATAVGRAEAVAAAASAR